MKKILFLAAAVAAMTFAACGNKSQSAAPAADSAQSDSVAAVDTASLAPEAKAALGALTLQLQKAVESKDPKAVTTALANLEATYKTLVNTGNLEDAKTYGSAIKQFVSESADSIKQIASGNTTIAELVNGIANLPTTAETTAEQAKAAVSEDVVNLASSAIAKGASAKATAETAAAALKNAPATAASVASAAATTAVETAKTNAENKVNEKVNETKEKANDAVNKAANKANEAVNNAANKAVNSLFK
jgi:hypothetical protein